MTSSIMTNSIVRDYIARDLCAAFEANASLRIKSGGAPGSAWVIISVDIPGAIYSLKLQSTSSGLTVHLGDWTAAVLEVESGWHLIALLDEFSLRKYAGTGAAKALRAYVRRKLRKIAGI